MVYQLQACVSESTFFSRPFRTAETSVGSTFPWQEFVLMQPGNYTLELYLQDIGQLATWWKGNKRHFRPWRFPESFSFCACFCWRCRYFFVVLCVFLFFEKDEGNSTYQKQWDDNKEVGLSIWFYWFRLAPIYQFTSLTMLNVFRHTEIWEEVSVPAKLNCCWFLFDQRLSPVWTRIVHVEAAKHLGWYSR